MPDVLKSDERGRVTIPARIREKTGCEPGQPFELHVEGNKIVLSPLPKNPEKKLDELLGGIKFDRKARKRAEEWLKEESS